MTVCNKIYFLVMIFDRFLFFFILRTKIFMTSYLSYLESNLYASKKTSHVVFPQDRLNFKLFTPSVNFMKYLKKTINFDVKKSLKF